MKSLVITLTLIFTSLGTAVEKPNVIFILADDVGIGDIKCFYPKSRVTTPNIDRLASQGMRFTQAYAPGAVCSPSRYALLTGAYPCRGPIRLKTANSYSPLTISSDSLTLPRFFKNSGYQTAHIGKWHLGFGNSVNKNWAGEISPSGIEIGFDYQFALPINKVIN